MWRRVPCVISGPCRREVVNECNRLFASLDPPIDIPAHVRVIARQLTAAYLGSRARPGKERELSGPSSRFFSHTGTFLEQQVIMDIYV